MSDSYDEDDKEIDAILTQATEIAQHAKHSGEATNLTNSTSGVLSTATTSATTLPTAAAGTSVNSLTSKSSTALAEHVAIVVGATAPNRRKENIQTVNRDKSRVHVKVATIAAKKIQTLKSKEDKFNVEWKENMDVLAKPKAKAANRSFASDEDERHCRFYPKKTKSQLAAMKNPACGYDFVNHFDDEDQKDDFVARSEAAEYNRQKRLQATRGEEEYNLRQNKKQCPRCSMTQSYAEFRDKKKRCTFCGVLFALPKAWGDIANEFLERMEIGEEEKKIRQTQLSNHVIALERESGKVPKSTKQRYYERNLQVKASLHPTKQPTVAFQQNFA
ncbi:hypothetical protein THRCLA_02414 [Thraustotheca clavata]|uniref:Uncharacterized protein n=1 Tax=Thraustotheca clavata TaxID=74557 RepID=A0A1W0A5B2_9STRA|nr:hypothetical protein THRCLA_02414 [Thraustotheca clavata]